MSSIDGAPTSFPSAELDRRFYAFTLDRLLAWSLYAVAVWVAWILLLDNGRTMAGIAMIAGTVLGVSVVGSFVLGLLGTSAGKAAVGLRVVDDTTGTPIGVGPALLRTFVLGVAALPTFGFGVATLAWTAVMDRDHQRRGWHDHLTRSVVVDVRPAPPEEEAAPERPRQIVNLTAMRLVPASPTPPRDIPVRARSRWAADPSDDIPAPVADQPMPAPAPAPARAPAPAPAPAAPAASWVAPAPPANSDALRTPTPAPSPTPTPTDLTPDALSDRLGEPGESDVDASAAANPSGKHAAPPASSSASSPAPSPAATPSVVVPPARSTTPRWSVTFDTGDAFVVDGFTLVGRNPEARAGEPVKRLLALPSTDMSLSKTHAQFQVVPDGNLVVMDRGSTNGSLLIRGGVTRELGAGKPATLRDGDVVRFGDREMRVVREEV